jgi:peptidoglycan/LPS O-acetylase OafA/YrhL
MTSSSKVLRYVVGGLLIGGFWYLNRDRPPWEEALRTIIVFAILMMVLKARLKRRLLDVHLVPLIASKAVLVVIAAIVEQRLGPSTSNPSLIVAIGLAVAVALLGPIGDSHYFSRAVPPDRLPTP